MNGPPEGSTAEGAESSKVAGTGARVLRELIRTPAFMEIVKTDLASIQPERARELISTLVWSDPNLSLSLIGAIPDLFNYLVECLLALGRELGKFTPELLGVFLNSLGGRIDVGRIRDISRVYGPLLKETAEVDPNLIEALSSSAMETVNSIMRTTASLIELMLQSEESYSTSVRKADGAALGRLVTEIARFFKVLFSDERFLFDFLKSTDWKIVLGALIAFVSCFLKALGHLLRRTSR